jgi:butyrate kinase
MKHSNNIACVKQRITGKGGLAAYCGTNSLKEAVRRSKAGEQQVSLIIAAMAYQVSKEIAMHGATLRGEVDGVVLTGGMAAQPEFVEHIRERVSFLAPVLVIPGECEMSSLVENAYAALSGQRPLMHYGEEQCG